MGKCAGCINWQGGKRKHANRILPLIPQHRTYVEPFCGGASILLSKLPSFQEVINDLDGDLIHFWRTVRDRHDELIRSFDYELCSRQIFSEYAERFRTGRYTDDIQRAHIFYYLNRATFGGKMSSPSFGVSAGDHSRNKLRISCVEASIRDVYERMRDVVIENLPYQDVIRRYDRVDTFFFLDPPYRGLTKYRIGGGAHFRTTITASSRNYVAA